MKKMNVRLPRFARNDGVGGYVAIATVIVVGAILLTTGITVTLNSISQTQLSLAEHKKESALGRVEACVNDGLWKINKMNSLPGTIVLPEGSCTATINSHTGSSWDVTFSGILDGYTKNIRIVVIKGNIVTVSSWLEI